MKKSITILLADDDDDDRFFFADTLKELAIPTTLITVQDGQHLMDYLLQSKTNIPDILFLDVNMPRKKGSECLVEIKSNKRIQDFPIVIYSTGVMDTMAYDLFEKGAHYCMKKGDLPELVTSLQYLLRLLISGKFFKPSKEHFIIHPEVIGKQLVK